MKIASFPTAVACLLLIGTAPVLGQTVTRTISINPYGMFLSLNAERAVGLSGQGVILGDPDEGIGSFSFGFTVPEGYAPGTPLVLRLLWRSEAISCVVDLKNNALYRSPGGGGAVDAGAFVKQSTLLAPDKSSQTEVTLFSLNGIDDQSDIQAGDAIIGSLFRSSALDSCSGDLHILGVSIRYEALTSFVFSDRFEKTP